MGQVQEQPLRQVAVGMGEVAEVKKPKGDQTIEADNVSVTTEQVTVTSGKATEEAVQPIAEDLPLMGRGSSSRTVTKSTGEMKPPILQGLVAQPTAMPTNKWLFYTGGILLGYLAKSIVTYFTPELLSDQFWDLLPMFIGGLAAYLVKDARNS